MKTEITYNNITIVKEIPSNWDQVKFKDFLELDKCGADLVRVLALFTGQDEQVIRKAKIKGLDDLIKTLSFVFTTDYNKILPYAILGYPIPKNLEFKSMAQYADVKAVIDKGLSGIELLKQFPLFCAIFATNPYDSDEAEKKVDEFLNAPCTEVLAVGNFTLVKLIALKPSTGQSSPKRHILPKNLRLVLKLWLSRLAFTLRFYSLKRKLDIKG